MSNTNRDIEDFRSTLERYYEKGLNDGRNEAWECAKECFSNMKERELEEVFGKDWAFYKIMEMTPQEALAKLEAYEKEQNEIKVGDIVFNDDTMENGIVTYIADDEVFMLYDDGSCGLVKGNLTKTGKHIDLTNIFKQIGGTE